MKQFEETGCLCKAKSRGWPPVKNEVVKNICETFVRIPTKSTRRASAELNVSQSTVWRVLRKRLQFKPFTFQMVQALKSTDKPLRRYFCVDFQAMFEVDGFASRHVFTDEATFHLCGKVNRHNLRFWGMKNPHATLAHECDSLKVNVFCAITNSSMFGPFSSWETRLRGLSTETCSLSGCYHSSRLHSAARRCSTALA